MEVNHTATRNISPLSCKKRTNRVVQNFIRIQFRRIQKRRAEKFRRKARMTAIKAGFVSSSLADHPVITKRQHMADLKTKLEHGLNHGQRVCIDFSLGSELMSSKQSSKAASQLGRIWGVQRNANRAMSIHLAGIDCDSNFGRECGRKIQNFQTRQWRITEKPAVECFDDSEMVYLTPDSEKALMTISSDCVYVIGGLVDETRIAKATFDYAQSCQIRTARLPIREFMKQVSSNRSGGLCPKNLSPTLTLNQVFEALSLVVGGSCWPEALRKIVPKRFGLEPITDESIS